MGILDDAAQGIKGKVQEVKGKINTENAKNTGDPIQGLKGGWQQLKGKANQTAAKSKLRAREDRADVDEDL